MSLSLFLLPSNTGKMIRAAHFLGVFCYETIYSYRKILSSAMLPYVFSCRILIPVIETFFFPFSPLSLSLLLPSFLPFSSSLYALWEQGLNWFLSLLLSLELQIIHSIKFCYCRMKQTFFPLSSFMTVLKVHFTSLCLGFFHCKMGGGWERKEIELDYF